MPQLTSVLSKDQSAYVSGSPKLGDSGPSAPAELWNLKDPTGLEFKLLGRARRYFPSLSEAVNGK
jgi:hypothetical protein